MSIENPAVNGQVQGKVTLRIQAQDPSGKPPYVSLFIDHGFKTLRNYAPYEFSWDTTAYANGYHTIEAFGYNDAQDVGHAQPLRVFVNNPGGRTERRTDLKDAPKPVKPVPAAPKVADIKPVSATGTKTATAVVSAKPLTPIKAASIPRRPVLAVKPTVIKLHTPVTRLPALSEANATTGSAALSNPFVAEPVLARPKTVTPTRGFKPLLPSNRVTSPGDAVLAMSPTAASKITRVAHLQQVAKSLPQESLSFQFLKSPRLPALDTKIQAMTVRPAAPTCQCKNHSHILACRPAGTPLWNACRPSGRLCGAPRLASRRRSKHAAV